MKQIRYIPSKLCKGIRKTEDTSPDHGSDIVESRVPPFSIPSRSDGKPIVDPLLFCNLNVWLSIGHFVLRIRPKQNSRMGKWGCRQRAQRSHVLYNIHGNERRPKIAKVRPRFSKFQFFSYSSKGNLPVFRSWAIRRGWITTKPLLYYSKPWFQFNRPEASWVIFASVNK